MDAPSKEVLVERTALAQADDKPRRIRTLGVVLAVSLGFVMAMLDVTVVNVALSDIQSEFGSDLSTLVWVVDAYTLTFASLLLLGGSLADWLGAKNAYMAGLALFIVASGLCGIAPSTALLIVARLIQGCGAALFLPSSLTLLTQSFPDRAIRVKMVGIWGAIVGAAASLGPFIGGLLVHEFGWRSIFALNLPIGAFGLFLTFILIGTSKRTPRPFDIVSHVLLVGALSALSFTLIEGPNFGWLSSHWIVLSISASITAIILFLLRERISSRPVIPLDLFRNRVFWSLNGSGFLLSFVLFGEIFLISLFLQKARHASALQTGIKMLPIMGIVSLVNYLSGQFTALWGGRRIMTAGYAIGACGAIGAAVLGGAAPYWQIVIPVAICTAGIALAGPAMIASVMHAVGDAYANVGSATLNAVRQIGALCGVAIMGVLLGLVPDWQIAFRMAFATFAVCLVLATTLVHRGTRSD